MDPMAILCSIHSVTEWDANTFPTETRGCSDRRVEFVEVCVVAGCGLYEMGN